MSDFLSDLSSKKVLIFGVSGSIGFRTAITLLEFGSTVYGVSKTNKLDLFHPSFLHIFGDCTNISSLTKIVNLISAETNNIDTIVFCVGINDGKIFQESDLRTWLKIQDTNVNSLYHVTKKFYPLLKTSKHPTIIVLTSIRGIYGGNSIAYSTSKSALNGFILTLASNLATDRVRVVGIAPGPVDSKMLHSTNKKSLKSHKKLLLSNELISPQDVANLIAFLASERSRKINGTIIEIADGFLR